MKANFTKNPDGLLPAIVQDHLTGKVLMLGYMNQEALDKTLSEKKVTFFSRSKKRLWTKGEESGHFLHLVEIKNDCDEDSFLIKANPDGPTCHTGDDTCWKEENKSAAFFIEELERIIKSRIEQPSEKSYTTSLVNSGINKVAQKVGEEAVELVIEAMSHDKDKFLGEAADLLFHYLVLLQAKGYQLNEVVEVLQSRHKK